jgi:hypothetical protein
MEYDDDDVSVSRELLTALLNKQKRTMVMSSFLLLLYGLGRFMSVPASESFFGIRRNNVGYIL